MGRKCKEGVDYFPLDTTMDTNVDLLEVRFGLKGFAVFIKLYQYIYGQHGYYGEWDEDARLLFCRKNGLSGKGASLVSEVAEWCMQRDLFSKEMFDKYEILTSHGIQKQYCRIAKKRENANIEERYSLVHDGEKNISSVKNTISSGGNAISSGGNTQIERRNRNLNLNLNKKETYTADKPAGHGDKSPRFNYKLFGDYWNHNIAEPTGLPTVREPSKWTSTRKTNLKARVKDEGEKAVLKIFDEVKQSDFLSGRANGFQATFDWVIKAGNFQKIADGNYKNRNRQKQEDVNPFLAYAMSEETQ